eukprot:472445-Pyramimonas_sp.AAC.1
MGARPPPNHLPHRHFQCAKPPSSHSPWSSAQQCSSSCCSGLVDERFGAVAVLPATKLCCRSFDVNAGCVGVLPAAHHHDPVQGPGQ